MIGTIIKHYILDAGLDAMFQNIASNFNTYTPETYLRKYWCVFDEEKDIVAYGYCVREEGNMITLVDIECEYVIHVKLFEVIQISAQEYMELVEEDEENDANMVNYLESCEE